MILMIDHDAVVQSASRLPPLPQSAARLLNLLANSETHLNDIAQVIEFDPILTMKLLRMANSIASAPTHRIGTVREAVIRLGTKTVSGLAIGASVQPLLGKSIPGYEISGHDFWRHSLAAALATEVMPRYTAQDVSPFAFSAALLHDIGKLVLGQLLSSQILELLSCAMSAGKQAAFRAEMEILSMHHGEVGGVIAQHWGLPESIVKAIIHHHDPEEGHEAMCSITCLANCVAHAVTDDAPVEPGPQAKSCPAEFALQAIGISRQDFEKICQTVADRLAAVSAAYQA